jgi:hypothetical protein
MRPPRLLLEVGGLGERILYLLRPRVHERSDGLEQKLSKHQKEDEKVYER